MNTFSKGVFSMLTPERHQLIIDYLEENDVIKIQDLTIMTDASESTIRRDLSALEEKVFLKEFTEELLKYLVFVLSQMCLRNLPKPS